MCINLDSTTLQNIQTIINAKRVLVAELTKSTNKLIATLRNRVQLAVNTEAQDNLEQEKQLTSNDAIMKRWIRNSEAGETGLEARLDRIEERVKRRQVRARVKFRMEDREDGYQLPLREWLLLTLIQLRGRVGNQR